MPYIHVRYIRPGHVIKRGRLRWFGHVERKEVNDWVSACRNLDVAGSRGRGRPKMTWRARLDVDMKDMGLKPGMAMDREKWRLLKEKEDKKY
jgi:hypothetical protein